MNASMPNLASCTITAALALALALPLQAAQPSQGNAAAERPFIETSYLIAPERIGDFELEGAQYDETNKYAGAGFRYALKDHQETRIDVFVYPAGRFSEAAALEHGMREFKAGFGEAEKAGQYRDLHILAEDAFPLEAATPVADAETATPEDKKEANLRRILQESTRTTGRVLRMRMDLMPVQIPLHSNGYLFYRNLYFFKVRASAATDRIDEAAFNQLVDMAARTLVPAIEVANVGGCASSEIVLDPNSDPDKIAEILLRRSIEIQGENCFADAGKAEIERKSDHARRIEIHFTAQDWKSE